MVKELGWKEWLAGGIAGGIGGFLLGLLAKKPVMKWKEEHGIDDEHRLHHADIGMSIATLGAVASSKISGAPIIVGFGAGLASEDYISHLGLNPFDKHAELYDIGGEVAVEDGNEQGEVEWKSIPSWPPQARTAAMADIVRKLVWEDANHPYVRKVMEDIIRGTGLDGRDTEAILRVMQVWFHTNMTYVHDPARGPFGEPTDRYAHAYITLPGDVGNPKGTAMGDCDDLTIAYCAMALSIGLPNIVCILVDQGRGYAHIAPGYVPSGKRPKSIDDAVFIELTEPREFGWKPRATRFGFILL